MAEAVLISDESRYKDTLIYSGESGPEFGLWDAPVEFTTQQLEDKIHKVRAFEVGFLDLIAVRYYGPGYETLWWVIAQHNAIIDPEIEMFSGQSLRIPSPSLLNTFTARPGNGR